MDLLDLIHIHFEVVEEGLTWVDTVSRVINDHCASIRLATGFTAILELGLHH